MAITLPNEDDLAARILANYRVRFPSRDLSLDAFLGELARSEAMVILQLYQGVQSADNDSVPSTKTSTAALDLWAVAIGVSDGAGSYGRKKSTAAKGLSASGVSGTKGASFPDGSLLNASDGVTQFTLNNSGFALTIAGSPPGTGTIAGTFDAVTPGTVGNLAANSVLTWVSPPSGADSTVTITGTATTLGVDIETDASLLTRILAKMQSPPKGGSSSDFRSWAESISGVYRSYSYPLRGGLGTAHVVISGTGSGTNRKPSSTIQTAVDAYISGSSTTGAGGQRSVTMQGYKSILPYMPDYGTGAGNTGGLTVRVRMKPAKSKYGWDWDDTAASYTVAAYSAGPPATVTLSTTLPATLTAAVDAATKPRIQILVSSAGGPTVPLQVGVTAYNAGTKVLTLDTLPTGWVAPTVGDTLYAGGPTVTQTATAILDYIDGLGPSRAGGYAEAVADFWEDTAAIARITQIALDQKDADGSRFFSNTVSSTSTTIANGTNAAASTDVEAQDTTSGVELLYAKWVAVTQ